MPGVLEVGKLILKGSQAASRTGEAAWPIPADAWEIPEEKKIKRKTSEEEEEDNKYVIKVSDAVNCVIDTCNTDEILQDIAWSYVKRIWEIVWNANTGAASALSNPLEVAAEEMIKCIRENALRQDRFRLKVEKKYWARGG